MYEVAVIGAGPAGGSAAIFTAKAGKKMELFLIATKCVTKRALMENHYGVEETSNPDLVQVQELLKLKKFCAERIETKVTGLTKTDVGFKIATETGEVEAKHIIIATGFMTDLAEAAGLQTKDGTEPRVKTIFDVDAAGKINIEGIWAAGNYSKSRYYNYYGRCWC